MHLSVALHMLPAARFPSSCNSSSCFSNESLLLDFPTLLPVSLAFLATLVNLAILSLASARNAFICVALWGKSLNETSLIFSLACWMAASKVFKVRLARPSRDSIPASDPPAVVGLEALATLAGLCECALARFVGSFSCSRCLGTRGLLCLGSGLRPLWQAFGNRVPTTDFGG